MEVLAISNNNDKEQREVSGDVESGTDGCSRLTELCPFAAHGECRYGENCLYLHGNECELCGRAALMPGDEEQNRKHQEVHRLCQYNSHLVSVLYPEICHTYVLVVCTERKI